MERLASLVEGRVIAIALHGASIAEAARHAGTIAACEGVVWIGINHFSILESQLLQPASQEMSVVFCCADGELRRRTDELRAFLDRAGPRLLVTRPDQFEAQRAEFSAYSARILLQDLPSLYPFPNSLLLLLKLLWRSGPRRIVLLGADGFLGDDLKVLDSYFAADQFQREGRMSGVLRDTLMFNRYFAELSAKWATRSNRPRPEILNCSPGSSLFDIPVIPYDRLAPTLRGEFVVGVPPVRPQIEHALPGGNGDDPRSALALCAEAVFHNNLTEAHRHALHALLMSPGQLSQLAFRVLQTDRSVVELALNFLGARGAESESSPDHWRWLELRGELDRASRATLEWASWY